MYYHRYSFLSLVALAIMPLSASGDCRSDFPGYITQFQSGTNEQIEDAITGAKSLYIDTICSSSGVKVFVSSQTKTSQIFESNNPGWGCETNLNMFVYRPDSNPTVLTYDFPAKGGNVVVNGCSTTSF